MIDRIYKTDEIVEQTQFSGLYWIRNDIIKTTRTSRIVLPSPGQGIFTVVTHGEDFSDQDHKGYDFYGIHIGQVDVLSFMALDNRIMRGIFVDCRKGSPTLRHKLEVEFKGDPDRSLVIDRGIAHIFDNLKGTVTLNQPRMYYDLNNPFYNAKFDVINIKRSSDLAEFPVVRPNRIRMPDWICRSSLRKQRSALLESGGSRNHPFIFQKGKERLVLTPTASKQ